MVFPDGHYLASLADVQTVSALPSVVTEHLASQVREVENLVQYAHAQHPYSSRSVHVFAGSVVVESRVDEEVSVVLRDWFPAM